MPWSVDIKHLIIQRLEICIEVSDRETANEWSEDEEKEERAEKAAMAATAAAAAQKNQWDILRADEGNRFWRIFQMHGIEMFQN